MLNKPVGINSISLLGSDAVIKWLQTPKGLTLKPLHQLPGEVA
tara:strand:+ start:139 stop:267 length:129 start_codon:yes stop_codon:yes gene_type:complete